MRDPGARLGQFILAASIATTSLALGAANVAAADPGAIQTPFSVLKDPGPAQCPDGLEVALPADPAVGGLPGVALFKNPGPNGCAPGVTVSRQPGPPGAPGTVAELPLDAADCAVGVASLQATADALGLVVAPPDPAAGPGPTGCASGDTLAAAIAAVLVNPGPIQCPNGIAVGVNPGPIQRLSPGLLVLKAPGPPGCPSGIALGLLPAVQGVVRGALVLKNPGPIGTEAFVIVPGGASGYGLVNPGPSQ
jgi:hypothetical protein